jgi:hypothetical protein
MAAYDQILVRPRDVSVAVSASSKQAPVVHEKSGMLPEQTEPISSALWKVFFQTYFVGIVASS